MPTATTAAPPALAPFPYKSVNINQEKPPAGTPFNRVPDQFRFVMNEAAADIAFGTEHVLAFPIVGGDGILFRPAGGTFDGAFKQAKERAQVYNNEAQAVWEAKDGTFYITSLGDGSSDTGKAISLDDPKLPPSAISSLGSAWMKAIVGATVSADLRKFNGVFFPAPKTK